MSAIKGYTVIQNEPAYYAAVNRNIIANAQKTWRKNNEDYLAIEAFISQGRYHENHGYTYDDNFLGSLAKAFDTYGKLSEKQCDAVRKSIIKSEERKIAWEQALNEQKARSEFLGVESEKAVATLTLEKKIEIEVTTYSYYQSSHATMYLMRDEKGNRVVYKTQACLSIPMNDGEVDDGIWYDKNDKPVRCIKEGDTFVAKFTIKAHKDYKGEKQTIVQRLKITERVNKG